MPERKVLFGVGLGGCNGTLGRWAQEIVPAVREAVP